MKLLIFGATGGTGFALVSQALDEGHRVTVFARNPKGMNIQHADLKVVRGNILDYQLVDNAVQGHDVVLSALGVNSFKKNTILSDGTRNIIKAMEGHHVKRFICVTSLGVGDSKGQRGWAYMMPISLLLRLQRVPILRHMFRDKEVQEEYIKSSTLDWIIVRPAGLTNGPPTGDYRYGFSTTDTKIELTISRADVADFMLKQITDDTYLHKAPSLSY